MRQTLGIPVRVHFQISGNGGKQRGFFFIGRVADHAAILFGLAAQHQQQGGVAAVVQNHVGFLTGRPFEDLVREFPVLVQALALEGKYRDIGSGNGCGGMILRREDIAGSPAHVGTQFHQRFNQHASLDGHVQRTGNACATQRLLMGIFFTQCHQTGHFCFGDCQFLAPPGSKIDVSYVKIGEFSHRAKSFHTPAGTRLTRYSGIGTEFSQVSAVCKKPEPGDEPRSAPRECRNYT